MAGRVRIGVDIGGTFTDIVAVDGTLGKYTILKVPSTPTNYVLGIKTGLERLFSEHGWRPSDVALCFHGTTVATNTVIEKKGAKTGLLTTVGFRDVLEVGRTERPPLDLYNLAMERPKPLVPRRLRLGVPERINHRGEVVEPLDTEAVREAIDRMLAMDIEALAISFLNAYANPVHERRAREIARSLRPDLYVAVSSEVNPQFKEFERTSTTVLSSYVGPRVSRYMEGMKTVLAELGVKSPLHIMQASGGAMTVDAVAERAVHTVLSGPAAGVLGALKVGEAVNEPNFVSFDMGGTSTDVSLVKNGQFRIVEETKGVGYHLRMPMMDITTIGAGGGSIAWIDTGGVLKVGPNSAGAEPGPACYGMGRNVTVTDAHVLLGYIDPGFFLGGEMRLDTKRAHTLIQQKVAVPLGLSVEKAAAGIVRIANANMIRAIKRVSIERGHDVRDFSLIPFGGAGGLHAGQLLGELGMRRVIVPIYPGVLSACGLVEANLEYQCVQTILKRLDGVDASTLRGLYAGLEIRGRKEMHHIRDGALRFKRAANLRYRKQVRQVTVELGSEWADHTTIRRQFREAHERLYGYATDEPVEIVDIRVACIHPPPEGVDWGKAAGDGADPQKGRRRAYFEELDGFVDCPVYARGNLGRDFSVQGPAIVEQDETNTVVRPGQTLTVHPSGNLFISPGP